MDLSAEINVQFNLLAETFRELLWTQREFTLKLEEFLWCWRSHKMQEEPSRVSINRSPFKRHEDWRRPKNIPRQDIVTPSIFQTIVSLDVNEFKQLKSIFLSLCPSSYCVAVAVAVATWSCSCTQLQPATMKNVYSQVQSRVRFLRGKHFRART